MPNPRTRILIVDDDPACRATLVDALGEHYEARGVAKGSEALAALLGWSPECILLDLRKPGTDEKTLRSIQRTLNHPADIPVFVFSEHRDLPAQARAMKAAGRFPKQFDLDALIERLEAALHTPDSPAPALRSPGEHEAVKGPEALDGGVRVTRTLYLRSFRRTASRCA